MTRRLIPLVAVALALVGLLLALWPRAGAPPAAQRPEQSVAGGEPEPTSEPTRSASVEPLVAALAADGEEPPMTDAEARAYALDHAQRSLELYQEAMKYPPWSRPADDSTRHILEWNQPYPAGQPFAADKDRRELRVDATLDRLYAGPGEALTATLRVSYIDDGTPAAPDLLSGGVEWNNPESGWETAAEVAFEREGATYVARFVPSSLAALTVRPREAQFFAQVRLGEFHKRLPLRFVYAAEAPFVVHGVVGDRLVDGSLEVLLDVEVRHAVPTLVQAGLYDRAGKQAIAVFDDYVRPTAVGRQTIGLRFFGKVLRERGLDGPYRLRALHGHVRLPDQEPPEVFWSHPDEPAVLTKPYRALSFSDADWTSPEKDGKVALYQRVIDGLQPTQ